MQSDLSQSDLGTIFKFTYEQTLQQIVLLAPKLIIAIGLLLLGWLAATLLAKTSYSLVNLARKAVNKFFPNTLQKQNLALNRSHVIMSKVIFWLVMLFFIAAASNALGLAFFSKWIEAFLSYFPQFFAGVVIIFGGFMLSRVVRLMVVTAASSANFKQTELLGSGAQIAVFVTALVVGVEQLGINVQFLTHFFITISAVLVAGFSLAFGLGTKSLVENIIGAQQARRRIKIGDKVEIGEHSGILIEMTNTAIIVESEDKTVSIPGRYYSDNSSAILPK